MDNYYDENISFEDYVKARTKRAVGRVLTAVETTGLDERQFNSAKSLIQVAIYDLRNDILGFVDEKNSV